MIETFRLIQYQDAPDFFVDATPNDINIHIITCIDKDKPLTENLIRKEYISLKKKPSISEELEKIRQRAPDLFKALEKDDKSLINEENKEDG